MKARGFRDSLRVVAKWATRRRRAKRASDQQLQKIPSARTITHLMTTARDHLGKADTVTIAAIEAGVPLLEEARVLLDRFHPTDAPGCKQLSIRRNFDTGSKVRRPLA